ncbi:MAG: MmgE/PrpD family protein [Gammaproteobacteria bacterium]
MTAITQALSEFAAHLSYAGLPQAVSERAKLLILDTVGIALRARYEAASTPSLLAAVAKLGMDHGKAAVIGMEHGFTPPAAAWLNGAFAHSLDFDDTHARSSLHPSAPIVPAALAAAEMVGASGREVIAAVVAGYETQIRLSLALVPKDHYTRGFHPTATCGVFGAAAAAGRIFGLNAAQIASAFGICLSQTAGSMQFLKDGAWTKLFQVGYAAMNGLIAARLAGEGFKGAAEALEGKAGFLASFAPNPIPENAIAGLGDRYETLMIAVKPYPSCRYTHAGLDGLLALRAAYDIDPVEVEAVEVGLPRTGWNIVGNPLEAKHHPHNVVDGQFSMPFVAAVALREGRMGWDDYATHIKDPATLALGKRVDVVVDPRAEAEFPAQMSAAVRIRTGRGEFERFVKIPKGEPENFLNIEELRAKFDSLVAPYLSDARAEELAGALLSLDHVNDISALLKLTRASHGQARRHAPQAE